MVGCMGQFSAWLDRPLLGLKHCSIIVFLSVEYLILNIQTPDDIYNCDSCLFY
jgi:hypothetical protein